MVNDPIGDMIARIRIEQRLAVDDCLADVRIEINNEPRSLVLRGGPAERELLSFAETKAFERDAIGQFRLRLVVVVIVRQVCEIGPRRADAACRRQRFVETHMGWMRLVTQRVEHGDFHALDLSQCVGGNFLAVA